MHELWPSAIRCETKEQQRRAGVNAHREAEQHEETVIRLEPALQHPPGFVGDVAIANNTFDCLEHSGEVNRALRWNQPCLGR